MVDPKVAFILVMILVVFVVVIQGFATSICRYFILLPVVMGITHEADNTSSIWSTWSCYWLDQFLSQVSNKWNLSKFSMLNWICLLFILFILVGVEFSFSLFLCFVLFSGVKSSIRLFCFIINYAENMKEHIHSPRSKDPQEVWNRLNLKQRENHMNVEN